MKTTNRRKLSKIATVLAAVVMTASFGAGCLTEAQANGETLHTASMRQSQTALDEFIPVFRMAVCSDIHIGYSECDKKFEKFIDTSYAYADGHATYQGLDVFAITGDLTQNPCAIPGSYEKYRDTVNEKVREDTMVVDLLGNHDLYGVTTPEFGDGLKLYQEIFNKLTDRHVTKKGFHFISLSNPDEYGTYTKEQIEWLRGELAIAAADDPDKPIFTFQHQKVASTAYGTGGWGASYSSKELHDEYAKYSQIINFSGHSHTAATTPRSIWQGEYTALESGPFQDINIDREDRFYYIGTKHKILFQGLPFESRTTYDYARYYRIVEVDAENRVRIYTINRDTGEFVTTPSTLDDPNEKMIFEVNDLSDPDTFLYTDDRKDGASSPYFEQGAKITVVRNQVNAEGTVSGVELSFPQMQDNFCPYLYKIEWWATNGPSWDTHVSYEADQFFDGENVSDETVHIGSMTPDREYQIKVTPVNLWGLEGEALETTVTAAKK